MRRDPPTTTGSTGQLDAFAPSPPDSGGDTSRHAARTAEAATTGRSALHQRLREALLDGPLTREQLCDRLKIGGDTLRPRVWELMLRRARKGTADPHLEHGEGTRLTAAGKPARVLQLTSRGREYALTHRNGGGDGR